MPTRKIKRVFATQSCFGRSAPFPSLLVFLLLLVLLVLLVEVLLGGVCSGVSLEEIGADDKDKELRVSV